MHPHRVLLRTLLIALFPVVSNGALQPSCDPSFNSGFGLGSRTLVPANKASTAAPTGPYSVGVRFESYCFQGRRLTLSYWYPAVASSTSTPFVSAGGILGQAVENAAVDTSGGPYPPIVFSPGVAAINDAYYFYTQNLASHGYIVVSIQHLDARNANVTTNPVLLLRGFQYAAANNTNDAVITLYTDWFRETAFGMTYRPQEISFAIDQTVASATNTSSPFHGAIDTNNIGMSGHSMGGFYTNVVGGGMAINCDFPMPPSALNPNNTILADVNLCAFPARQNLSSATALHDSRIKAIVTLAAPTFLNKTQVSRAAQAMTVPQMIITGDNSTSETPTSIQRDVFRSAAGPSYWVQVKGTNHYLVADAYGLNPTMAGNASPGDKADFGEKAGVYMEYSAAFFDGYLKGNKSAVVRLGSVTSPFVEGLEARNVLQMANSSSGASSLRAGSWLRFML